MTSDLFPQPWLINNLLDAGFIEQKATELSQRPLPHCVDAWLAQHFDAATLASTNEAQLEHCFIRPLLEHLGWHTVPQMVFTVQGKQARPDWCLALDAAAAQALPGSDAQQASQHLAAICEAKAWTHDLDTGKAHAANPHHQLMDYLATLRTRFGILTNGRHWRLYDTSEITARKTYLQIDLQKVLALPDAAERKRALALFAFFFGRDTYVPPAGHVGSADSASPIEQAIAAAETHALAVEENLKAVIYGFDGEDSLFELMGKALWQKHAALPANERPTLAQLYENTVMLLFRLLFIVYFEDRNRELLQTHPFYPRYSLKTLYQRLRAIPEGSAADAQFDGVHDLKELFQVLDEGAQDIDIPLFNGGLFDPARAPLLLAPKIFSNAVLRRMLERLLYKTRRGQTLFDTPRDFNTMSVTHLGRIYEGLLEFRFELAHEAATYVEYTSAATKGKVVEAYFDSYDNALIRKEKGFRALREFSVRKGELYLKNASNSRKTSASYYTPAMLAQRLVKAGIDHALAHGKALADVRVLDNACGSGHFLVEALDYLTDLALQRLPHDAALQQLVTEEGQKIAAQLAFLNLPYQPADAQIIKRVLLKRCIYGVDLNLFAVELARLSLWMDSFIFGTPLSFIEHHIRHGNALLGASVQDFIDYNRSEWQQNDLFVDDLRGRFDELRTVMDELDALRDTTAAEVAQSKAKWRRDIAPRLALLSRTLSFLSTRRMLLAAGDKAAAQALDKTPDLLTLLFDSPLEGKGSQAGPLKTIAQHAAEWHFFHYEVAFPEAFGAKNVAQRGFDVIVGNPPWDKTKFADTDFFPQYHSNYRQLKNSEKTAVQKRLLASEHIARHYQQAQQHMAVANEACKAQYPLNRGAGDGNLFRFFVERNLGLLAAGGSLNYCLPSALMFEEGSLALRQHILSHYQMVFFYSFENNNGIFPDIHRSYKFALMQIARPAAPAASNVLETIAVNACRTVDDRHFDASAEAPPAPPQATPAIDTAFYLLDAAELDAPARHVPYPLATLKTLSPHQWALMELRHAADLPILQRCYAAFKPLSADWLDFRNELHMTNDKDLFLEKPAKKLLPLYEGKMIWQFSHRLDGAQYWLDTADFDERLRSKELHRMAQDLGIKKAEAEKHASAIRFDREYVRLAFRDIARDTDERTLIFALLPTACGVGNTINISVPKRYASQGGSVVVQPVSALRLLFALAWFNSLVVDWLARFMIQIHANKTYLYRLPMPQPADEDILASADYRTLARNALLLTLRADWDDFAHDLAGAMRALDVTAAGVPATAKAADQLRADNDRIVARLYGLGDAELAHMLGSFAVMAKKRPEYLALLHP
ncbi:DNA methyltransferase [Vandammella animalimorsus]|uniref:Eco57I restriction-modification methylase domain-containing protein n=1 Tax=Vandammella animalimorsus TaxID=2029117 RepID=UPI0031BAE325